MKFLEDQQATPDQAVFVFAWFLIGVAVVVFIDRDSEKRFNSEMNTFELLFYPFVWVVPAIIYALVLLFNKESH